MRHRRPSSRQHDRRRNLWKWGAINSHSAKTSRNSYGNSYFCKRVRTDLCMALMLLLLILLCGTTSNIGVIYNVKRGTPTDQWLKKESFCDFLSGFLYSMCSLAVSTQDSPAVEPRSNPGSGKILMSENLRLYTTSPVVMC